ncbi:MAG: Maf family protein [Halothiobacillaceae bacterium]
MRRLILASTSPRRAELLRQIGVAFELRAVEVDESPRTGEMAAETTLRLAVAKAAAGMRALRLEGSACSAPGDAIADRPLPHQGEGMMNSAAEDMAVLAADTLVSLDGEPLGKPRDREDFFAMLRRISGRRHQVYTAVALAWEDRIQSLLSVSHVDVRPLQDAELVAYWETGEPVDKAGGYAIQGLAASFISRLEGSFSGVMGLPLFETAKLLQQAGIPLWNTAR